MLSSVISFAPHVDFAAGTSAVALVAADFNADGNEDLAVADPAMDKVSVFLGNGSGGFSAGQVLSLSSPPSRMITGDFNGDGKPDLAVACTAGAGQSSTTVDIFLNTGQGTFGLGQITTVQSSAVPGEVVPISAGDFNQDGHLDLAVGDYTAESISILLGTGTGTFAAPINYQSDAHPTAITTADFNNDSFPDLAVTSTLSDSSTGTTVTTNTVSLLLDSSGGNFSGGPNISLTSSGIPTSVVAGNFTGATTPGLVVGSSNGAVSVFTNTSGNFAESAQPTAAAGSTAVAVGDFDLDGNTDIVSADGGSSTSTSTNSVTVVQGAGSGTVANASQFATGGQPADVVVADFNNDGKPDLATANQVAGTVSILLNNTAIPLVTTKTVAAAASTSVPAGSAVTVTATITQSSTSPLNNEELPTGSVNFYDGSVLLSTVTLASASTTAVFSTSSLIVGAHHLRALYSGDNAYAGSSSAGLLVTITPTATEGPDLVGTFVSSTLPAKVAPGETGAVTFRVTNQGNTPAISAITNQLYLSLDNLLDGGDTSLTVRGSLAHTSIHFKPGQSVLLTGSFAIPQTAGLASYFFLANLNSTGSLAESVSTNNLAASPTTYSVADVFGTVDGRKNVVLSVMDNNGTSATFRLSGPGMGTVNVGDNGVDLLLDQTTAGSSVTAATKGSVVFQLHDLSASSAVRSLSMPTVYVSDAVTLTGGIGTLNVGAVGTAQTNGSIAIGGGTIASISISTVPGANLNTTGGIRLLSINNWDNGTITSPWIASLRSKQTFGAALKLSGSGAPGGTAIASATIGGAIGDVAWTVTGNVSRLSAGSFTAGWSLNDTGTLRSISSRGAAAGINVTASTGIQTISILGPADASTLFSSASFPKKAVVGGAVVDPTTDAHFRLI